MSITIKAEFGDIVTLQETEENRLELIISNPKEETKSLFFNKKQLGALISGLILIRPLVTSEQKEEND